MADTPSTVAFTPTSTRRSSISSQISDLTLTPRIQATQPSTEEKMPAAATSYCEVYILSFLKTTATIPLKDPTLAYTRSRYPPPPPPNSPLTALCEKFSFTSNGESMAWEDIAENLARLSDIFPEGLNYFFGYIEKESAATETELMISHLNFSVDPAESFQPGFEPCLTIIFGLKPADEGHRTVYALETRQIEPQNLIWHFAPKTSLGFRFLLADSNDSSSNKSDADKSKLLGGFFKALAPELGASNGDKLERIEKLYKELCKSGGKDLFLSSYHGQHANVIAFEECSQSPPSKYTDLHIITGSTGRYESPIGKKEKVFNIKMGLRHDNWSSTADSLKSFCLFRSGNPAINELFRELVNQEKARRSREVTISRMELLGVQDLDQHGKHNPALS